MDVGGEINSVRCVVRSTLHVNVGVIAYLDATCLTCAGVFDKSRCVDNPAGCWCDEKPEMSLDDDRNGKKRLCWPPR